MAASGEHFSLRWNNYSNHITNAFDSLRSQEDFVDVTLCCEGRKIRAHKVLLSACSLYFRDVFKENPCQHPVIVFKNVQYEDLLALIEFMYQGEVNVQQDSLPSFLSTAELLSVQGLTGGSSSTPVQAANESPIISIPTSQANYLTSHQSVPTKIHHVPLKRTDTTPASKLPTSGSPNIKTFSVQAVVNKTQMPLPITIPTTVKLRAIPAASADTKANLIEHPIVIHHQQQQQQNQAMGIVHQTIDKNPVKKRRMSLDLSSHVKSTRQIIEDTEYVLSDAIDTQEHHIHQQTSDEVDTQDEEEEDEEETPTISEAPIYEMAPAPRYVATLTDIRLLVDGVAGPVVQAPADDYDVNDADVESDGYSTLLQVHSGGHTLVRRSPSSTTSIRSTDTSDATDSESAGAPWSEPEVREFLKLYETRLQCMRNEEGRVQFWLNLAHLMGVNGFPRTEHECRSKWKHLCRQVRRLDSDPSVAPHSQLDCAPIVRQLMNVLAVKCLSTVQPQRASLTPTASDAEAIPDNGHEIMF